MLRRSSRSYSWIVTNERWEVEARRDLEQSTDGWHFAGAFVDHMRRTMQEKRYDLRLTLVAVDTSQGWIGEQSIDEARRKVRSQDSAPLLLQAFMYARLWDGRGWVDRIDLVLHIEFGETKSVSVRCSGVDPDETHGLGRRVQTWLDAQVPAADEWASGQFFGAPASESLTNSGDRRGSKDWRWRKLLSIGGGTVVGLGVVIPLLVNYLSHLLGW